MDSDRVSEFIVKALALAALAKASFVSAPTSPIIIDIRAIYNSGYGMSYWKTLKAEAAKVHLMLTDGSNFAAIEAQYA